MYNQVKQTNKNIKLHRNWAQGDRVTSLQNLLQQQKKKVETNLSKNILNSSNYNNVDINNSTRILAIIIVIVMKITK